MRKDETGHMAEDDETGAVRERTAPFRSETRFSDAVGIARVICITGIVYVHAWTGIGSEQLLALAGSPQDILRWVLMESLGKSAVPLLGLISGYFVQASGRTRDWRNHYATKARTIALPMLIWNAIAILLVSGTASWFDLPAPRYSGVEWLFQELTAFSRPPDIEVQMPFLRDLLVCMAFAPLLVRTRTRWLLLLGVALFALCVSLIPQPVLLRPSILLFFVGGMLVQRSGLEYHAAGIGLPQAILPYLMLLPFKIAFTMPQSGMMAAHPHAMAMLELIVRVTAALAFWRLAWELAQGRTGRIILRFEAYAFFMFCCHLILIWLAGPLIGKLTGPMGSPLYPVYLILQPFMVLAASVGLARLLLSLWPGAALVLSGGRVRKRVAPGG